MTPQRYVLFMYYAIHSTVFFLYFLGRHKKKPPPTIMDDGINRLISMHYVRIPSMCHTIGEPGDP